LRRGSLVRGAGDRYFLSGAHQDIESDPRQDPARAGARAVASAAETVCATAGDREGRALARRGRPLFAADRAHHRPERAPVLSGEAVPAGENPGSGPGLFEPHADIIRKDGRQVQYGHKLNLAAGRSGLILDVVVEAGNPADAERFLPMLDRHIARSGRAPRQTAADGG